MPDYKPGARIVIFILSLFLMLGGQLHALDSAEPGGGFHIIPGPDPFSLDAGSAVYCIDLLRDNRFLEREGDSGQYRIVEVRTVWSWFLEYDESYPEGHRKRYNIIVNGKPLDWDNSYIEYGGEMLNLRLLFLYRNQYPPKNLEYYLF